MQPVYDARRAMRLPSPVTLEAIRGGERVHIRVSVAQHDGMLDLDHSVLTEDMPAVMAGLAAQHPKFVAAAQEYRRAVHHVSTLLEAAE
jgi:hypothetical protein